MRSYGLFGPLSPAGPPTFPSRRHPAFTRASFFSVVSCPLEDGRQTSPQPHFRIHNGGCTPSSRNLDHGVSQSLPTARNRAFQTADLTPLRTELLLKQCLSTAIAI